MKSYLFFTAIILLTSSGIYMRFFKNSISNGSESERTISGRINLNSKLTGDWDFEQKNESHEANYVLTGEVTFNADGTFERYVNIATYSIANNGEKPSLNSSEGGKVTGVWKEVTDLGWEETNENCTIGNSAVCQQWYSTETPNVYGNFNTDHVKFKTVESTDSLIYIEGKDYSTNGNILIKMIKKKNN